MDSSAQLFQYALTGITVGSIYALIALGFTIIYTTTGVINFAQGEFVMLGGIIMASLSHVHHLPLPFDFAVAVCAVMLVGLAVERLAIHPIEKKDPLLLIISTIGVSIILKAGAAFIWGKDAIPVPRFSGKSSIELLGASVNSQSLWVLGATLVVMCSLAFFFRCTAAGRAMRACASNRQGAQIVGINTERMSLAAFGLGAAVGAVAGTLIAPIYCAGYNRGTLLGLKGFCAAIVGGMGSATGAAVGGILIGVLESFGCWLSSAYKDVIALVVMIVVLCVRPQGIMGKSEL